MSLYRNNISLDVLEPVTGQKYCRATVLGADVALCISSCSSHPFFCHRQRGTVSQLTAAFRYCNTVSQARELCRGADRNKKDRSMSDLFVWRLKQRFPWQGKCHGVTKGWLRGTSSSNLWLWICCRQLPLPHCIATTKQFTVLFCLRQITAACRYCDTVSRVRELCRGADRNKKTAHRAIFSFGASNRDSPNRGNVTGDKRVTARYEQLEPVGDVVVQK